MSRYIKGQVKIESQEITIDNFEEVMNKKNLNNWLDNKMKELKCDISIFFGENSKKERSIVCEYFIKNRTINECRSVQSKLKKDLRKFFNCKISIIMGWEGTLR